MRARYPASVQVPPRKEDHQEAARPQGLVTPHHRAAEEASGCIRPAGSFPLPPRADLHAGPRRPSHFLCREKVVGKERVLGNTRSYEAPVWCQDVVDSHEIETQVRAGNHLLEGEGEAGQPPVCRKIGPGFDCLCRAHGVDAPQVCACFGIQINL